MSAEVLPSDEKERLDALNSYHILDTAIEADYEDLTELAAAICETPIALISFVDKDRQWFKSHKGLPVSETDRAYSFCAHAINDPGELMEISDARTHVRFKDNPLVTGNPEIVFYAGMPLVNEDGFALGSLCVIDTSTKKLTIQQQKALKIIAHQVISKLELRRKVILLENSEKRFRTLSENIQQLAWLADPTGYIYWYNRRWYEYTGTNYEQMQGWGWQKVHHPDFVDVVTENFNKSLKNGTEYDGTFPLLGADGQYRWFLTRVIPERDNDGEIITWFGTNTDVTDQIEAHKAVEESEERFRIMAEGTDVMIAVGDESGKATYFNKAWEENTGRSVANLLEFGWVDLMHPDDSDRVMKVFTDAFRDFKPWEWEFRMPDKNGGYRWLLARGTPRFRPDGLFAGYISATIDITERKSDEQRKGDFIGIVSHELKTPLTSMSGYIQMLSIIAKKNDDHATMNVIDKAKKQVVKMGTLINNFLDVTRVEAGKIRIDKSPFDMADLVRESEEESLATVTSHNVIFAPVEPTKVDADYDKISQVVTNLINNAVKYSPPDTTIRVVCETIDGQARVCVQDEGMGIKPKDREQLFDRFYRVESAETRSISGFGIGLYLCAEIIRRHDGKIWVESEWGKGSTFYFSIPLL